MAEWTNWPERQQEAVIRLFETAFHSALETGPDGGRLAGSWLCGLAALDFSIEPYLAAWGRAASPQSAVQLALFINEVTIKADGDLKGDWWHKPPQSARRAVAQWLLQEQRQLELVGAVGQFDAAYEWEIELAMMRLESAT